MLQKHVNPDNISEEKRDLQTMAYSSRYAVQEIPKYKLPKSSTEAKVAYQLIHDELELDGRPSMNLASFVHTWMEDEADKLVYENIAKNLSDQDEYPATMTIQGRCISIIGNLWHAEAAIGTATVGSSEAVMLGGLALKKRWQERQRKNGKDTSRPNIIMGNNAQVALEKFARYFDVEMRLIPVSEESHHILDIHKAVEACDENTIGIFCILGSTFTGHFEDVLGLSKLLDDYEAKTGLDIAIHVDAASGGFVAPFAFPDLKWDFRLKRVVSINASGHKFGLSYCGIGWVLWRSTDYLPKELVFQLDYLGSIEYTYNLNFSRPACFMISQYYNFIRLGHEGYKRVMENDLKNARLFAYTLEETGYFDVVSDLHRPLNVFGWQKPGKEQVAQAKKKGAAVKYNPALPVVSFKLNDEFKKNYPHVQQAAISTLLRTKGWIVPNYKLPPAEDKTEILRVVVRESLSREMIDRLVIDVREAAEKLKEVETEASQMLADVTGVSTKNKHEAHEHRNVKRPRTFNSTC